MAGKKISQLDTANTLVGTEQIPIVQDARTRKTTIDDIVTYQNTSLQIFSATKTIATADVLTLGATPVLVVTKNAGLAIEVISATASMTYNAATYTTNGVLELITATATDPQYTLANSFLFGTTSHAAKFQENEINGVTDTQLIVNQNLNVQIQGGGNPAVGDSDIVIHVLYRLISF